MRSSVRRAKAGRLALAIATTTALLLGGATAAVAAPTADATPTPATATAPASGFAARLTLTGTPRDGSVLTAVVSGAAPVPASVTYVWRAGAARIPGASGARIRLGAGAVGTTVSVTAVLRGATTTTRVRAETEHAVYPGVASERRLGDRLRAIAASEPGTYAISVRELEGAKRSVSVRGSSRYEPASVIKLFLAYAALKRVDRGTLHLSSVVGGSSTTVAGCLRAMIEVSDNQCMYDLRDRFGIRTLNAEFARAGFSDTAFLPSSGWVPKRTSTDDLARFVTGLERGTLLGPASSARLLRLMKQQIWRSRVAAGLPEGIPVGSKIGEISGVESDASIVWGARSTYVIAVLGTGGATRAGIAHLSRVVYQRLQGAYGTKVDYATKQFVTTRATTFRATPSGRVLRHLPRGTVIGMPWWSESIRRWYLVSIDGRSGYIWNGALSIRPSYRHFR